MKGFKEDLVKEWLVENLPYEVMWMNENGKIVYANSKFSQRLGYTKSEILKLSIFDINSTATEESWKNHWKLVMENKEYSFKATHKNKKGNFYDVEVSAQFFSNNRKNLICAIVNDITESSFYKKLLDNAEKNGQCWWVEIKFTRRIFNYNLRGLNYFQNQR